MGGNMKCRNAFALLGAALSSFYSLGCMSFPEEAQGEIPLETHVDDWRDEVIYQVLVDRFADGDAGNNFRVDLTAQGHWHGGDWKGLEDNLDYLQTLGVTTLWISPVVKNVDTDAGFDGYHGYWTQDFNQVNPHFGDLTALRSLVRSAHDREMKVILDIVTNHVGQLFYYDINKNGQPDKDVFGGGKPGQSGVVNVTEYDPEFDSRGVQAYTSLGESGPAPVVWQWDPASNHVPPMPLLFQDIRVYNRKGRTFNFDDLDQLVHGDFPGGLKDVDTSRCEVKREMSDIFARWIELTDIDGFRIDTVKHVEHEFWRYFSQSVRQRLAAKGKTNFFMFGEAFDGKDDLIGSFTKHQVPAHLHDELLGGDLARENAECPLTSGETITGDMLDGVFYFSQYFQAMRDVFRDGQSTRRIQTLWEGRSTNFGTEPNANSTGLPPTKTLVNFLDNHDVPRFLYNQSGVSQFQVEPKVALKNALLFLLTEDGIPCIYYGTEQELNGGNDPANREDLWNTGYRTDIPTYQWIQKLTTIRKRHSALTRGDQKVIWSTEHIADEEDAGIFAFERTGGDAGNQYALVVFNTHHQKTSTTRDGTTIMTTSLPSGSTLVDILVPEKPAYIVDQNGTLELTLPPVSGMLLVPGDQVTPED
ncbi:MAG: alpha-amylase [Polyangiaceae bacterium]|nr:alpha-amylase [Polyangiaceae bacterium]